MTPRLYANPFVKDAPDVVLVSRGEPYYPGPTYTTDGVLIEWHRDVQYSDGTVLTECVSRERLPDFLHLRMAGRRRRSA